MKIRILSDLHFEILERAGDQPPALG